MSRGGEKAPEKAISVGDTENFIESKIVEQEKRGVQCALGFKIRPTVNAPGGKIWLF